MEDKRRDAEAAEVARIAEQEAREEAERQKKMQDAVKAAAEKQRLAQEESDRKVCPPNSKLHCFCLQQLVAPICSYSLCLQYVAHLVATICSYMLWLRHIATGISFCLLHPVHLHGFCLLRATIMEDRVIDS